MKRVIGLTLALIVVFAGVAMADGVGAFSAFETGVGARALAMGGAFAGIADDAMGLYWNPAGLGALDDTRLAGMSTNLYGLPTDLTHQYVGVTTSVFDIGVGLAWERFAVGGTFDVTEQAFIGSVGANVLDYGLVGANVKYYMANNTGVAGSGFGFDLGLQVGIGEMFTVGISAKDLGGTQISYDDGATDVVNAVYKAGLAMSLLEEALTLAADLDFGTEIGDAHVGLEFQLIDELALRGGVVLSDSFQDFDFTVGVGIYIAGLYVDAAYILNDELGNSLVLSAEFSLGDLLGGEGEQIPAPEVTEPQ